VRRTRRPLVVGAIVACAAAALVVPAQFANALVIVVPPAPGGLVYQQAQSARNSATTKVVEVDCPDDTAGVGGDAIVSGTTSARINGMTPTATGFTVTATEASGGTADSWRVVAAAVCAPVGSLPGLDYVEDTSDFDTSTAHSASAGCDGDQELAGMGGQIDPASGSAPQDRLVLTAVRPAGPVNGATSVTVAGHTDEAGETAEPWRVRATAVCVDPASAFLVGATAGSARNSQTEKVVTATPDAPRTAHAVGFDLTTAQGQAALTSVNLTVDAEHSMEVVAREDPTGFDGDWNYSVFVLTGA